MSYDDYFEEWEERYFGGNYSKFCEEYSNDEEGEE